MREVNRRKFLQTLAPMVPLVGSAFRPLIASAVERKVKYAHTTFGDIAYTEKGRGQPALFVHGVFLNGYLWRHVVDRVADVRRTITVDLMGHGETKISGDQDVSFAVQAEMLEAVCENLKLSQVDLVGNDSGGGIAQIFAARHPERIRSLTLTNCDTHDNWPGEPFQKMINAAATSQGLIATRIRQMLGDVSIARAGFAQVYEHPDLVSEETFWTYLEPLVRTTESSRNFERFLASASNRDTLIVEPLLKRLNAPTLIVWAMDDVTFGVRWAYWLRDTIPGTRKVVQLDGARLFFPEERPSALADALHEHWRGGTK